jgi:hypothetical protein
MKQEQEKKARRGGGDEKTSAERGGIKTGSGHNETKGR